MSEGEKNELKRKAFLQLLATLKLNLKAHSPLGNLFPK